MNFFNQNSVSIFDKASKNSSTFIQNTSEILEQQPHALE